MELIRPGIAPATAPDLHQREKCIRVRPRSHWSASRGRKNNARPPRLSPPATEPNLRKSGLSPIGVGQGGSEILRKEKCYVNYPVDCSDNSPNRLGSGVAIQSRLGLCSQRRIRRSPGDPLDLVVAWLFVTQCQRAQKTPPNPTISFQCLLEFLLSLPWWASRVSPLVIDIERGRACLHL